MHKARLCLAVFILYFPLLASAGKYSAPQQTKTAPIEIHVAAPVKNESFVTPGIITAIMTGVATIISAGHIQQRRSKKKNNE